MYELSKNLRTHIAVLRDWSELHLTDDQYSTIRLAKDDRKSNEFITIKDPDTWKIEYDWELWNIREFRHKEVTNAKYNVICDYWNKHPLVNWTIRCDCKKNYWYEAIELKLFAKAKYNIIYPWDITSDIRKEFYLFKKEANICNIIKE